MTKVLPPHMQEMVNEGRARSLGSVNEPPPAPAAPAQPPAQPPAPAAPAPAPAQQQQPAPAAPAQEPNKVEPQDYAALAPVLKQRFGEDVDSFDKLEQTLGSYKSREEEYKKKLSVLELKAQEQASFASPEIAEFNEFAKATKINNYGVFSRIKSMDLETAKTKPLEVMLTKFLIDNPEFVGREEAAKDYILGDLGFDTEEDLEKVESMREKTRLEVRAKEALRFVQDYKEKIKSPEAVDYEAKLAQQEQHRTETRQKLAPVMEKVLPLLSKFKFQATQESAPYEFDFDKDTVKQVEDLVMSKLLLSENPFDEKTFQNAASEAHLAAVAANIDKILLSHANTVRALSNEEFRKHYTQPSAADPNYQPGRPAAAPIESGSDKAFAFSMGRYNPQNK